MSTRAALRGDDGTEVEESRLKVKAVGLNGGFHSGSECDMKKEGWMMFTLTLLTVVNADVGV